MKLQSVPVFLRKPIPSTLDKAGDHRPDRKMPFKWRFAGGQMLWPDTECLLGSISKKTYT